jgi:hypothetical protein
LRVGFTRKYSIEVGMASALMALGHECFYFKKHPSKFSTWVKNAKLDLLFCMSSGHIPPVSEIESLRKSGCKVIYWERAARRKEGIAPRFDRYFTIYDDGSGIYMPCAAADHGLLKKTPSLGVTLVAATKYKAKSWGTCRASLHKKIQEDLGNGFTIHGEIPYKQYDKRFDIMARSSASIAIWNTNAAVPLRMIEIPSCRTLLLSYPYPVFRKLFTPNEHYVETHSIKKSLEYLSSNARESMEIAENGYQHFLMNHTYHHRAMQVLEELECG